MKKILKKLLNYINEKSYEFFCKFNFRKQEKSYCSMNNYNYVDKKYKKNAKKYWKKYEKNFSFVYHKWYSNANGIKDVKYIPEDFFYYKIEKYFNDMSIEKAYSDKGQYKKIFPNIKQPETIVLNQNGIFFDQNYNQIKKEQAVELILKNNKIIIKPTRDSGGGKNVSIYENFSKKQLLIILKSYEHDYIIQKVLTQHHELSKLHKNSINTIRIMSMLYKENVSIISSIIRMGVNGSNVDNECSGGINCGIDEFGNLSKIAYDGTGKKYLIHPQGCIFEGCTIPSYEKIIKIIKDNHIKLPYFGLISWDFTVDEEGNPIMIEYNLSWCGVNFHQLHHGPLFGDNTDKILKEVTRGKKNG